MVIWDAHHESFFRVATALYSYTVTHLKAMIRAVVRAVTSSDFTYLTDFVFETRIYLRCIGRMEAKSYGLAIWKPLRISPSVGVYMDMEV
jgi:hypothetical protein